MPFVAILLHSPQLACAKVAIEISGSLEGPLRMIETSTHDRATVVVAKGGDRHDEGVGVACLGAVGRKAEIAFKDGPTKVHATIADIGSGYMVNLLDILLSHIRHIEI